MICSHPLVYVCLSVCPSERPSAGCLLETLTPQCIWHILFIFGTVIDYYVRMTTKFPIITMTLISKVMVKKT